MQDRAWKGRQRPNRPGKKIIKGERLKEKTQPAGGYKKYN